MVKTIGRAARLTTTLMALKHINFIKGLLKMGKEQFGVNAETLNAMTSAMGAVVMCMARQLTPEQREAFANDLARLAASAEKRGDTALETMLIDLQTAAR